jgi:hypothetical protein
VSMMSPSATAPLLVIATAMPAVARRGHAVRLRTDQHLCLPLDGVAQEGTRVTVPENLIARAPALVHVIRSDRSRLGCDMSYSVHSLLPLPPKILGFGDDG